MIYVILHVELAPGCRDAYLELIQEYVNDARHESGCIEYELAVEHEIPIALAQLAPRGSTASPERDSVILMQKWNDLDAYERHLDQPKFRQCLALVKRLIRGIDVQILQPVTQLHGASKGRALPK